ncbi:hypothetical protein T439DRAFT_329742 [Meredithblackwellia eburnea MCA 4105]
MRRSSRQSTKIQTGTSLNKASSSRMTRHRSDIGPASTPMLNTPSAILTPSALNDAFRDSFNRSDSGTDEDESFSHSDTSDEREGDELGEEGQLNEGMLWSGWAMILGSTSAFVLGIWSICVGPFIDTDGVWFLDMLAKDSHYKYLLVFLIPVTLYAVIVNWWGLKIFRHA